MTISIGYMIKQQIIFEIIIFYSNVKVSNCILAILKVSESFSIPMNFLFKFNAAIPVVPEPITGSNTIRF